MSPDYPTDCEHEWPNGLLHTRAGLPLCPLCRAAIPGYVPGPRGRGRHPKLVRVAPSPAWTPSGILRAIAPADAPVDEPDLFDTMGLEP